MKKLLFNIFLLTSITAFGQDKIKMPELDTINKVYTLEFSPDSQNKKVISAYMQGTTVKDSLRFWAEGTILIQNVMVTVLSSDKHAKIKVDIVKNNWEDSKINGYLEDGAFQESFDTAGKFGVVITSDLPGKPFYLAVWTSGERIPDMSRLYYPASEENSVSNQNSDNYSVIVGGKNSDNITSDTNTNYLMLALIVILVIIAIFLGLMVFRKKNSAMLLIFVILFGGNEILNAQAQSLQEVVLNDLLEEYTGVKDLVTYSRNLREAGYLGRQRPLDPIADADAEADVNSAGGPRLPSSCIPRRYGGTQEDRTGLGSGSNPMGGPIETMGNSENGSLREDSDSDGSKGLNDDDSQIPDEKVQEYEAEKSRLRNEHHNLNQQAQETLDEKLEYEDKLYGQLMDNAQAVHESQMAAANGNAELMVTFTTSYANQTSALARAHVNRIQQYRTQFQQQQNRNDASLERSLKKLRERYQDSKDGDSKKEDDESDGSKSLGNQSSGSGSSGSLGNDESPGGDSDSGSNENPIDNDSGASGSDRNETNNEACNCLDRAYIELDKRRLNLERLRIIYSHSMKKINAGIAFGDNVSGVHGVSGLAWQSQKMIILKESIPTLNKAYDDKYAEMIEALEENLLEIDRCERLLDYENWYNHAGFIYYQFMADKYKRN